MAELAQFRQLLYREAGVRSHSRNFGLPQEHVVMPDEQKWLFQTNLERFWKIVKNDNWQERLMALDTLGDILVGEAVRYGFFNNQDMIRPLTGVYRELAMKMPEEQRYAAYQCVADFVEQTTVVSVNAFLPFIVEDTWS